MQMLSQTKLKEEEKQDEGKFRRSLSPAFWKQQNAPSVRRLQEVAGQIKGKADVSPQTRPFSLTRDPETNDEDDFKSCNGNVELEQNDKNQTNAAKLSAILDRSWHNDPFKSSKLLKLRTDGDPLVKAELIALARRSVKKQELLRQKRNRGQSVADSSSSYH